MEEKENKGLEENNAELEENKNAGGLLDDKPSLEDESDIEKEKGGKNTFIFIGLVIGITILVVGLALFLLMFLSSPKKNNISQKQTPQSSNIGLPSANIPSIGAKGNYLSREDIEKIKEELKREVENNFNEKFAEIQSKFTSAINTINVKIKEINNELERLKNEIADIKVKEQKQGEDLRKIEVKIKHIEEKIRQLKALSQPVIKDNYPVLGSIDVDEITPDYINIDGTNYWVGDTISVLYKDTPKDFTITKIDKGGNYIIVEDEWGNKYLLKVQRKV